MGNNLGFYRNVAPPQKSKKEIAQNTDQPRQLIKPELDTTRRPPHSQCRETVVESSA